MNRIVLVTGTEMPIPDPESHLVIAALEARGVRASLERWDASFDWASADLVVVRTPWDYFHRLDEFLEWADAVDAVTRLANPSTVIRWNAHKSYLVDLADQGVPTVPTRVLPRGATPGDLSTWFPTAPELVVKPAVSISAIGALRAPAHDAELPRHAARLAADGDVLVQPFARSVLDAGEISLMFAGPALSHAVRKRPASGDYRVQENHGGSLHVHEATSAELAVAEAALSCAPAPCTYARVDLVDADTGPVVMELELIEPELFLHEDPAAADRFAAAYLAQLGT